jgi:hypothetical protein
LPSEEGSRPARCRSPEGTALVQTGSYNGGIDATHHRQRVGSRLWKLFPKRKRSKHKDAGNKDADQAERCAGQAVWRRADDGPETRNVNGGPARPWAVAGEKRIVADPAPCHERVAQQRQDHMAAAEQPASATSASAFAILRLVESFLRLPTSTATSCILSIWFPPLISGRYVRHP